MGVDGVDGALQNGYTVKLQNRGSRSGITFELKAVFDEMAKKGLIKDKDGKGLTAQDAQNMYAKLNEIHEQTGRATNYTKMQVGQEFNYTADELNQLALASGYDIVEQYVDDVEEDDDIEEDLSDDDGHDDTDVDNEPVIENTVVPEGGGTIRANAPVSPVEINSPPQVFTDPLQVTEPPQEEVSPPPPVNVVPQGEKPTPEQVQAFMAADSRVADSQANLSTLQSNYEALQRAHDEAWNSFNVDAIRKAPSLVDVAKAQSRYENTQRAISQYQQIIENWQDGKTYTLTTGQWAGSEFKSTTLPNGQKGYVFEKMEDNKKVLYYFNISFDTKFGMASGLPGELVERVEVDETK